MPVGCEGVPGAGGARDKWTSRVSQPRLLAGKDRARSTIYIYIYIKEKKSESDR